MQCLQSSILLLVLLAGVQLGRPAPRQPSPGSFFLLPRSPFNFPEGGGPKDEPKESPEPRHLVLEPEPLSLSQKDLRQLLEQMGQGRSADEERGWNFHKTHKDDKDDKDHKDHITLILLPGVNNTINNIANATNPGTATTPARTGDFLRAPIGYPVGYPMQYFRKRGDEDLLPVGYPSMYGWNEPSMYGGLAGGYGGGLGGLGLGLGGLRGGYSGLTGGLNGGLNGGLSGALSGVPLVPVTIGNEVRYVPLNLRMFRQLVNIPVREKDDPIEEDDLTPFRVKAEQEPEEVANDEEASNEGDGNEPAYGPLVQRMRQRRRRPLQTLGNKIRQVQFL